MDSDSEELEETFNRAAEFVQSETTSGKGIKLEQDKLLKLYGYYKVATVGKCNDSKPGFFDPRGRAKWYAWKELSNLTVEEGMKGYVKFVAENYRWDPKSIPEGGSGNASALGGSSVSSFAKVSEDDETGHENTIFAWVRDNDFQAAESWLKEENSPNIQDDEGLSPLHWAVDRGHYELTELLLKAGADPKLEDNDGQTALDYAETCEYENIVSLLQTNLTIADKKL